MSTLLIGSDLDNTIVSYDEIFLRLAVEKSLVPEDFPADKLQIRNHLRAAGKEDEWTLLQGLAYGSRMEEARPFPGALEFFAACKEASLCVSIVSHRSRQPYAGPACDLHAAAKGWLEKHGFLNYIQPSSVFFETSFRDKIAAISKLGCTHFIDDLPEVLLDPELPSGLTRILFQPSKLHQPPNSVHVCDSWAQLSVLLLG
jgi:hypothetical protein